MQYRFHRSCQRMLYSNPSPELEKCCDENHMFFLTTERVRINLLRFIYDRKENVSL